MKARSTHQRTLRLAKSMMASKEDALMFVSRGLKLNSVVRSAAQAVHTATSNSHVRLDMAFVWMSFVWEAEDYL